MSAAARRVVEPEVFTADQIPPAAGELVLADPKLVLLDQEQADILYSKIKAEMDGFVGDTSTDAGRKEIARQAFRVTKAKTAIDAARKGLTEEWRTKTALVNAAGKAIVEKLDNLAAEVRAPLTAWEEAERTRKARADAQLQQLRQSAIVAFEDTSADVAERLAMLRDCEMDPALFAEDLAEAVATRDQAVAALEAGHARLLKEEADRAELEKLRAEAAAREEAQRQAEEVRRAEEARSAAARAEAEREQRLKAEAADRARAEAEAAAKAEQDRIAREHAEQLAAERKRAEEAERAAQAERDRAAAEEARRQQEAARAEAERVAREANQQHRANVMTRAKQAIMTCGVEEDTARAVVLAIKAGEVPHVTISF